MRWRRGSGFALKALRWLLTGIGILIIIFAVLTLLVRLALPLVDGYKSDIEAGLGDYLKRPVAINELAVRWQGRGPQLTATGVEVIGDGDTRVALDEALVDVDLLGSLLKRNLVINELTLVGADLDVERLDDGSIVVHGLSPDSSSADRAEASDPGSALDAISWLFNARRVGLLDTRFRIINDATSADTADLLVGPVDFRAEYSDGEHRLRVDLQLDESSDSRIALAVDLTSTPTRAFEGHANGRFLVQSEALDLKQAVDTLNALLGLQAGDPAAADAVDWEALLDIGGGQMSMQVSGALEDGDVRDADGSLTLDGVMATSGAVIADRLDATLRVRPEGADGWRMTADGLEVTRGDERLKAERLQLSRLSDGMRFEASGNEGSLQLAASLAQLVPAVDAIGWVDASAPTGRIAAWRTQVDFGSDDPQIDIVVSVPSLSFAPALGAPGLTALAMSLIVDDNTGFIEMRSPDLTSVEMTWPDYYSRPLALQNLDTVLSVGPGADGIRIEGPLSLTSDSLKLATRVAVDLDASLTPYLDIQGNFSLDQASEVAGFLPDRLLGAGTLQWFEEGLREGRVQEGTLSLNGRASDFPFDEGRDGEFRVEMQARGVDLKWMDDWPAATALDGTVVFDGFGFSTRVARGRIASMYMAGGTISIGDLRVPQLVIDASGKDELGRMLDFATTGPLRDILEPALGDMTGSGPAQMDLIVKAPLSERARREGSELSVDGSVYLRDNPLSLGRAGIDLSSVTGAVRFSEEGVAVRSLKAQWMDRPVSFLASMTGEGRDRALRVRMNGALEGADVLSTYGLPLDRFVRGASQWSTELVIPFDAGRQQRDGFQLVARSDLRGSELRLPAPLYKSSQVSRPMTVSTRLYPDEPVTRWTVRQQGFADVIADVSDGKLLSLSMGLGTRKARTEGTRGIRIDGRVDVLDIDGWVEALATLISDLPVSETSDEPMPAISADIVAERSVLRNMPLGELHLNLNSDPAYLNIAVQNRYLEGNARYPRLVRPGGSTPLKIRLARVEGRIVDALRGKAIPDESDDDPAREGGLDPRRLPPIEAYVASLGWEKLLLEGVGLRTEPDIAGLNVVALGFSHDNLNLIGEGYWRLSDPQRVSPTRANQHETYLSLVLQSSDFGKGLAGIGLDGIIGGGAGRASAIIHWPAPAWSPDIDRLSGSVTATLKRGRLSSLEPGAGKLIGLFALQALPQRLNLDFSDVTNDGLAFSTLNADATIDGGVVNKRLVRLEGPIGVVDVTGETNLATQQMDQRITVLPRISAALPVIGAITGGASAGIGVLLAGGLLKALGVDFDRIGLREYRLHGSWEDPTLDPWKKR